jgi:hypothetical protein
LGAVPSVRVGPGLTALTRTPAGPHSAAQDLVSSFVGAGVQSEKQLKGPSQRRRGRRESLCQPQRKCVEQDIHHPRRSGTGGRSTRSLSRLPQAASMAQVGCPYCGAERLQVRLARGVGVERLKMPGRAQQQPGRFADASLVKRDLAAQVFYVGGPQRVRRPGLDGDQQPQRRVQCAGVALRPGRREQALGPAAWIGCQHRRALEERSRRSQAPARLGPAGRAIQLRGDLFVRSRRGLGPVPRPAVRIDPRVGDLRQRAVHVLSVLR